VQINKTVETHKPKGTDIVFGQRENSTGQTVYIIAASESELAKKENAAKSKMIRNAVTCPSENGHRDRQAPCVRDGFFLTG